MSEVLYLSVLGGIGIERDGKHITGFISNKAPALLCYLAISGRPHSRVALAGLFWGEMPETDARASLRVLLSNLRQLVGTHLVITRESIAFNRDAAYHLDLQEFEGLLRQRERGLDRIRRLEAAIRLYQGDFLDGVYLRDAPAFDEWAAAERERLRQIAMHTLYELAVHASKADAYINGIDYLGRLLSLDPWREDAYREMMLLLARSGQREAALLQYERCRQALRDGLGVEPAPATTELWQGIVSGTLEISPGRQPTMQALPILPTALLGRTGELERAEALLLNPACRLLTLLGPGGIGKTRLAIELAANVAGAFPDGVCFVDLSSISEPGLVATAIAQALDVLETGSTPLLERLKHALRDRTLLLFLDNFEHLLAAAPLIGKLLTISRGLKVIVTSRAVLHLRGEHVLPVPPLTLPDSITSPDSSRWIGDSPATPLAMEQILESAAVALFVERAQAVQDGFRLTPDNAQAVATICANLDGLPLAIELAAARVALLPPAILLQRLFSRLAFLTGGASDLPLRQQSLRATLAWSHDLLTRPVQIVFRRLAVFVGGFSLEAMETVCQISDEHLTDPLDGLQSLVNQSLVRPIEQRERLLNAVPRFRMLELIREYALEQLVASGDQDAVRWRHAEYYVQLAETVEPELVGSDPAIWMGRLELEQDNLRAVLAWSREQSAGAELQLRLAAALWWYWGQRGTIGEARAWLEEALQRSGTAPHLRARALYRAGVLAWYQDDYARSVNLSKECLALARQLGDRQSQGWALHNLGRVAWLRGDYRQAVTLLEESVVLLRSAGDTWGMPWSLDILGHAVVALGDDLRAMAIWSESLDLRRQYGDVQGIPWSLNTLGRMAYLQGDLGQARILLEESLARFRELGITRAVPVVLGNLGQVAGALADYQRALLMLGEALSQFRMMGEKNGVAGTLAQLADVALAQGNNTQTSVFLTEALSLYLEMEQKRGLATVLDQIARVGLHCGATVQAVRLFAAAAALRESIGTRLWPVELAQHTAILEAVTTELGASTFAAIWAVGLTIPLTQAYQSALDLTRRAGPGSLPVEST